VLAAAAAAATAAAAAAAAAAATAAAAAGTPSVDTTSVPLARSSDNFSTTPWCFHTIPILRTLSTIPSTNARGLCTARGGGWLRGVDAGRGSELLRCLHYCAR